MLMSICVSLTFHDLALIREFLKAKTRAHYFHPSVGRKAWFTSRPTLYYVLNDANKKLRYNDKAGALIAYTFLLPNRYIVKQFTGKTGE